MPIADSSYSTYRTTTRHKAKHPIRFSCYQQEMSLVLALVQEVLSVFSSEQICYLSSFIHILVISVAL